MLMRACYSAVLLSLASIASAGFYKDALSLKSKSLSETLQFLKSRYPESFSNDYTLIHTSNSLQHASGGEPRILLMSENGRSLMALSGCQGAEAKTHKVEFIDFGDDERFHFNQLEISTVDSVKAQLPTSLHNIDCQTCHRGSPIWDPYPFWPNLYKSEPHSGHFDPYGLALLEQQSNYQVFLEQTSKKTKCYYTYLDDLETHYLDRPGMDANTRISLAIGYLNYRRIAAEIMTDSSYKYLKFALTATLIGCVNPIELVPQQYLSRYVEPFESLVENTRVQQSKSLNVFTRDSHSTELARLRYILQGFNVKPQEWSTSFADKDHYNLVMPVRTTADYISAVLAEKDKELEPYIAYRTNPGSLQYSVIDVVGGLPSQDDRCETLKALSKVKMTPL